MLILFLDGVSALFKYGEMLNAVSRLLQKLINIIHASCFFKLECESTCCGFTDIINIIISRIYYKQRKGILSVRSLMAVAGKSHKISSAIVF